MKFNWLVMTLFVLTLTSWTAETVIQPLVVLKAPWGKEPGQFGFFDPSTTLPPGVESGCPEPTVPRVFTVDVDKIYIHDTVNWRVQVFSRQGKFLYTFPIFNKGKVQNLSVDRQGNIYLLYFSFSREVGWEVYLVKYSPTGQSLSETSFPFPLEEILRQAAGMSYQAAGMSYLVLPEIGDVYLNLHFLPKLVKGQRQLQSPKIVYKHVQLLRSGRPVADFTSLIKDGYLVSLPDRLQVIKQEPLGVDGRGNIYFEEGPDGRGRIKVRVSRYSGEKPPLLLGLAKGLTGLSNAVKVSPDGNLFLLWWTEESGLTISEWMCNQGG